jgi:hypothetical protein
MCKECGCSTGQECGCNENHNSCGCDCGCGEHGSHSHTRRYQTKAEQISELETYLNELKTETQAVEEHLADLRR